MNAETPLWLVILLAVLAPTSAVATALVVQRRADKRAAADREAALAERREERDEDRLFGAYREFLAGAWNLQMSLSTLASKTNDPDDYYAGQVRLAWQRWHNACAGMQLLAPQDLISYPANLNHAFIDYDAVARNAPGHPDIHAALNQSTMLIGTLINTVRQRLGVIDLSAFAAPDVH